ncbi:MAG: TraR/DksA C4-type zinc finger protein [Bacteroidota bacterium]
MPLNMDKLEIKGKLEEQIVKTKEKIANYEGLIGSVTPDDSIGRISRMDAINNQAVVEASLRQAKAKLAKLQHGLSSIDDPNFGKCKQCGRDIPPMRLVLMPESPFCVRCA